METSWVKELSNKNFVMGVVAGAGVASLLYLFGSLGMVFLAFYLVLTAALGMAKFYYESQGWTTQFEYLKENLWLGVYSQNLKDKTNVWVCLLPCLSLRFTSPTKKS